MWPTLDACTVDVWLNRLGEQIALSGRVPAAEVPVRVLPAFEEALVWRDIIAADAELTAAALFDLDALARTAAEAHALVVVWRLPLRVEEDHEEMRRFSAWRETFLDRCRRREWLDAARYRDRVLDWIERGLGRMPARVVLAGFDAPSPQLKRLQAVLEARGTVLEEAVPPADLPAATVQVRIRQDAAEECRAAATWAAARLRENPEVRLGIVVADLEARRALLVPIFDEILQPDLLAGASDAPPTCYNLSLGLPLAHHALAQAALDLLHALNRPQGLSPAAFGALLCLPYWSADIGEADLRARLDVLLRERPGQTVTIQALQRILHPHLPADAVLARHLRAFADARALLRDARRPGALASGFRDQLAALGWPGDRMLSSTEFQARAAFLEVLDTFATLDDLLGEISPRAAIGELRRLCAEKIFQPGTPGQPPVQVLGVLEAAGAHFDALWVMGMNDDLWPPAPHPNPLLPADLQRRHATPGAAAESQLAFAGRLHADLLRTAPEIVFSHAERDGERPLRPSPLLTGIAAAPGEAGGAGGARAEPSAPLPDGTASGTLSAPPASGGWPLEGAAGAASPFEFLDDAWAPPVAEGERVAGGSGLLKAQALCPAWAYYRYRLGAKGLATPADGLEASQRGSLVHGVLEAFWRSTGSLAGLQALRGEALTTAVASAAETALTAFEADLGEPLTPTLRRLEATRLVRLVRQWLRVEWDAQAVTGRAPFSVQACEADHTVVIGRLSLRLVIDRIDALCADGRRILIDYKTGGQPGPRQWEGARIAEPQLPLYAAFALAEAGGPGGLAAVVFARLKPGACTFTGLAVEEGLLPGVAALRTEAGEDAAPAWQGLIDGWRDRLEMLADEIQRGDAAVRFVSESDLAHCEVLPLLRVAERRQQFERERSSS